MNTQTSLMLRKLGIQPRLLGFRQLCTAIPRYAQGDIQSLSKELYPYVAEQFGSTDQRAVEHSIRYVIVDAWAHRDAEVWDGYFPRLTKCPSNKEFIATLTEYL